MSKKYFLKEAIQNFTLKKKSGHPPLSFVKECANLYLKKAGSHPVVSLKYCTIKINYRHKKQKMSDGEYGYSIGPSPPGSALAWCCQTPPATRLTRPPPGTSAPPVSRSTRPTPSTSAPPASGSTRPPPSRACQFFPNLELKFALVIFLCFYIYINGFWG